MLEKITKHIGLITILCLFFGGCFFVLHIVNSYIYVLEIEGVSEKTISPENLTCDFILTTKSSMEQNTKIINAFLNVLNKNKIEENRILRIRKTEKQGSIENIITTEVQDPKEIRNIEIQVFKEPVLTNIFFQTRLNYEIPNKEKMVSEMVKEASEDASKNAKEQLKIFKKSRLSLQSSKTHFDVDKNSMKAKITVNAKFRI